MQIAIASASASVTRTLEALILLSGHQLVPAIDAELVLFDQRHPSLVELPSVPQIRLGGKEADSLALPLRPQQLLRLLTSRKTSTPLLLGNGWHLDPLARSLTLTSVSPVSLTEKECALLHLLLQQPTGVSRETLLADVWGITHVIDTHTLETHIYRLRQKLNELNPIPCDIVSEGGMYKIAAIAA